MTHISRHHFPHLKVLQELAKIEKWSLDISLFLMLYSISAEGLWKVVVKQFDKFGKCLPDQLALWEMDSLDV